MAKRLKKYYVREPLCVAELKPACEKLILQTSGARNGHMLRSWLDIFKIFIEGMFLAEDLDSRFASQVLLRV